MLRVVAIGMDDRIIEHEGGHTLKSFKAPNSYALRPAADQVLVALGYEELLDVRSVPSKAM